MTTARWSNRRSIASRSNDRGVAFPFSARGGARCARRDASRRRGSRDLSLSLSLSFLFSSSTLSVPPSPAPVEFSTWHQREDIQRGGRSSRPNGDDPRPSLLLLARAFSRIRSGTEASSIARPLASSRFRPIPSCFRVKLRDRLSRARSPVVLRSLDMSP